MLFEPNAGGNKSPKPPLEMIPRKNLVALPTSPHGALETQWEAHMPRHWGALRCMFMQSDLLPAHKFDIFVTCHLKPLGVEVGWGGVGHVNVRLHLRHEVDATSRMGLGLGGVGWGMSTFVCTCAMKLMLRHA